MGPKSVEEQPRAVVVINGNPYLPNSYSIDINAHGTTDSGVTMLPMTDFDWTAYILSLQPQNIAIDTPSTAGAVPIKIYAGYPSNFDESSTDISELSLRFSGIVDLDKPNFKDASVEFPIRSLASLLLSNHTTTAVQNMTSVQFVKNAAQQVGLKTNIRLLPGQQPTTLAKVYAHDMIVGLRNLKNWDIIVACAEVDDVDVWVDQYGVLNYVAPAAVSRKICYLQYDHGDFMEFPGEHAGQFSKNILVEVRSYTPKTRYSAWARYTTGANGKGTPASGSTVGTSTPTWGLNQSTSTSQRNTSTGSSSSNTTTTTTSGGSANETVGGANSESSKEHYIYHISGLTKDECAQRAYQYWRQISMHEQQVSFKCAMTSALLPFVDITTFFQTSNMPWPSWNAKWWPRRITETFAIQQEAEGESDGWEFTVDAVNHALPQQGV